MQISRSNNCLHVNLSAVLALTAILQERGGFQPDKNIDKFVSNMN